MEPKAGSGFQRSSLSAAQQVRLMRHGRLGPDVLQSKAEVLATTVGSVFV
jgi:hypothetical protein